MTFSPCPPPPSRKRDRPRAATTTATAARTAGPRGCVRDRRMFSYSPPLGRHLHQGGGNEFAAIVGVLLAALVGDSAESFVGLTGSLRPIARHALFTIITPATTAAPATGRERPSPRSSSPLVLSCASLARPPRR